MCNNGSKLVRIGKFESNFNTKITTKKHMTVILLMFPVLLKRKCVFHKTGFFCGCSNLPVKDHVIDSASPVYQAVIPSENNELGPSEWTERAAQLQSKSFRYLAHITGTEYSESACLFLSLSFYFAIDFDLLCRVLQVLSLSLLFCSARP